MVLQATDGQSLKHFISLLIVDGGFLPLPILLHLLAITYNFHPPFGNLEIYRVFSYRKGRINA